MLSGSRVEDKLTCLALVGKLRNPPHTVGYIMSFGVGLTYSLGCGVVGRVISWCAVGIGLLEELETVWKLVIWGDQPQFDLQHIVRMIAAQYRYWACSST